MSRCRGPNLPKPSEKTSHHRRCWASNETLPMSSRRGELRATFQLHIQPPKSRDLVLVVMVSVKVSRRCLWAPAEIDRQTHRPCPSMEPDPYSRISDWTRALLEATGMFRVPPLDFSHVLRLVLSRAVSGDFEVAFAYLAWMRAAPVDCF